ncbi:hypothetical protein [Microcoleus sp. herbarium12]|uniref:hypothetical protein n=1 Tax=Microcoleus sp. herbarium12 TaxID=3055437 RepID=UPI002FD79B01
MKRTADLWDSVEILVAVLGDDFRLGIIAKNPDSLVYVVVRLFVQGPFVCPRVQPGLKPLSHS